jgi:hypothetical protein
MTQLLDYVILALAVYRLTRLITTDVILNKYREKIWNKYPIEKEGIGYLITCDWCTSIWVSSLVVAMYTIAPDIAIAVWGVFALSAIAGLMNRVN